ncbi:MAG: preprotein translocase subunit SecE [Candidatus Paceibacterota bacterium]
MSRLTEYLKDTKGELKHVTWPSKNQATIFTVVVVVFSLVVAAVLGAFDFIFAIGLKWFI